MTWRSKPSVVMSRYSTSAQYFGAAHLSILFLRSGIFERGDFANVMGFQRANSRIMVLAKPVPAGEADAALVAMAVNALKAAGLRVIVGPTWTTDAPFRETAEAIEAAKQRGILAVEMEAAALYTFARARQAKVLCIAHVTNTMGQTAQDFEKGEADGTADAMRLLEAIVQAIKP